MIVFLLTVAVAATPASGGDSYFVVTSTEKGHTAYMTVDPEGIMSEQQDMMLDYSAFNDLYPSNAMSFGNGIGDFNNGNGSFTLSVDGMNTGGPDGRRRALTALPFTNNKEPLAQLTPDTITVTVGETVYFDASASSDEDGDIVSYHWDYGEGDEFTTGSDNGENSGEAQSSHVYYDSGPYTVTLTVTDNQGATATVEAKVKVEPLKFGVYFSPSRLNLKSKGKWITATIRVPSGYDARGIDADNLFLVVGDMAAPIATIQAHKVYPNRWGRKHHKKKYRRIRTLKAKFDRQALIKALGPATGNTTLTVSGEIATGKAMMLEFAGKRTIKAYVKEKKKSHRSHDWKHIFSFFSKGKSR